jgi:hypothetical protein
MLVELAVAPNGLGDFEFAFVRKPAFETPSSPICYRSALACAIKACQLSIVPSFGVGNLGGEFGVIHGSCGNPEGLD